MSTCNFHIWGILNCTPDSFSDGDPAATTENFIARGLELIADGADVLDVGGASSRAGAANVTVDEELARVLPTIEGLRRRCAVRISIDTFRPEVADAALSAGATIVNDINGLRDSNSMAEVVANHGASVVAMHRRPEVFCGGDILDDIIELWGQSLSIAKEVGIGAERIMLDPGLGEGFHKPLEQNLRILKNFHKLRRAFPACEILFAASRKSFLGTISNEHCPRERDCISAAAAYGAYGAGLRNFRVHNVALTKNILMLARAIDESR
ncbi:MAG: dihydropteroate synthase [Puniceicoccales bacterium]|jgi:dihydropteroate synthase|nr:dihydropteroate synthase [Puniceicoccales bacterium]